MGEAQRSGDPFRMMIAGQRMAEHDAESLANAVRADPQLRGTIMVMVAANPTPQGCRQSLMAGFTEYLEKPKGISGIYEGLVRAWREAGHAPPVLRPATSSAGVSDSPANREANFAGMAPAAPPPDPMRMSVLVVDDNAEDRRAMAQTLQELGCQTEMAADGQQALEMWATRCYDLILMDCEMPEMDGYDATTEIRGLERLGSREPDRPAHTPIVALLDGSPGVSRMKCVARGMNGCLTKPFSPAMLKSTLRKFAPVPALVLVNRS
jgi:CheY-like chemotaxis protein